MSVPEGAAPKAPGHHRTTAPKVRPLVDTGARPAALQFLDDVAAHVGALLRRRATLWIGGAWAVLGPAFGMVVPYLVLRSGGIPAASAGPLLAGLLPAALPGSVLAGYTPYGGAYLLLLGAVLVGNEYRWGTAATLLVLRAGRPRTVLSQAVALVLVAAGAALVEFALCALTAVVIGALEGSAPAGPEVGAVLVSLAAAWLAGSAFALVGALLAHATRSPAAAVGIGLVWVLGVETAVRGLLAALGPAWAVDGLLGPAVGALAIGLGEPAVDAPFGVGRGGSPVAAVVVLLGWSVAAAALSALVVARRDVASRT
jgi:ABC-2 type transport system permease protein